MARAPKEEAEKFYEEFASRFPNDTDVLSRCLSYYVRVKDTSTKAAELAERIPAVYRLTSGLYNYQAVADFYLLKGDHSRAEKSYGKDLLQTKQLGFALDLLSFADYWAGKSENLANALEMTELALKFSPNESIVPSRVAGVFVKLKKDERALDLFGPAYAKKNWEDPKLLWSYANFWSTQGKNLDDALAAAERIVILKPIESFGWDVMSTILQKMRKFPEAVKAAQKAYDLADDSSKDFMKKKLDRAKTAAAQEKK